MRTIHHVLDIDAPCDDVWAALTEVKELAGWWSTVVTGDPSAPGGRIDFTFAGDFNPSMEVTSIDPGGLLAWKCVAGHSNWDDNTFTFEVVPRGEDGSRLRFTQHYAVELSDDDYGIYNFNWGYYLESLRLLCSTGTGKPFRISA